MVHALEEIHRVLVPGGLLVDARPDSRVPAYAERRRPRGFETFGTVNTTRFEMNNDRAADGAMAGAVSSGLFESRRRGRFWHRVHLANLAELRRYLREHLRFVHRAHWIVDAPLLRRHARDPFVIRRAVRYEIFRAM